PIQAVPGAVLGIRDSRTGRSHNVRGYRQTRSVNPLEAETLAGYRPLVAILTETNVQEAISKTNVLIEALPYIQDYYEKIVVVKLGGSVMDEPEAERELLRDIVFMNYVGMQPIIVHGGGKEINKAMDEAGLEPNFVQGLRYTDDRTLAIAER